jgi:preprotein translocase subunit SecG
MTLLITLLYILFVLSAIVLIVVILLQEGRGGGFSDALGAAGQQALGVGARGIHKFTAAAGAVFLLSALGIHLLNKMQGQGSLIDTMPGSVLDQVPAAPAEPPK